ncbi:beta-1,6-N-acetylglucosaminyltransferase [Ruegeria profundi]|uniref:beta-1,6-N-acetylglucosaminyltransferase n=1 Tax=Ruegeria profundi TaxID=1685378 RepID=UPI001CD4CFCA|nr:beta-1,6-N-acetylglucosaminyltransferase [Ruegeria profundi]MCA0929711.1 beta-1,6-N-acetylglucosaminyltransferase [Ruegeria profundi]
MSRLGIVMLVHTALHRAEQVARHWTASGCPVVIHVDGKVPEGVFSEFAASCADDPLIRFSERHICEWGRWGIVAASQTAAEMMLETFPEVHHVYLSSGACLPLRPVQELAEYLSDRPRVDFIESATTADVSWTIGGLDQERFTLRFPFSWRSHRKLFDLHVKLQRTLGMRRKIPEGLMPHMGSQWWCLTRQTLSAILQDPKRQIYDRYFRHVWIPDESYFQTLARLYSTHIESRSLTLSKFDYQGRPHIFYDDHLQLLRRSDCFVARKIWPQADRLYQGFLTDQNGAMRPTEPNPSKIDRVFSKAVERRTRGRDGLYMQSRFPRHGSENGLTSFPYSVFQGFTELFEDFEPWLAEATGARVHGHLFDPERVEFSGGAKIVNGALSNCAVLRDYNPTAFVSNLIWNTRGERQCFQFGPRDTQKINWFLARDKNAQISVITGAWAIPLFRSNMNFADIRCEAARLQQIETKQLEVLTSVWTKARVRTWTLAEFVESPMEPMQSVIEEIGTPRPTHLTEAPNMVDLSGFGKFLQNLKNQGMHPYLMGDFPTDDLFGAQVRPFKKPYLVQ